MKSFPYILLRLAGLPFPKLRQPLSKQLETCQLAMDTVESEQLQLRSALEARKNELSNYFEKQVIVNLLRDLDQGRTINFKKRFEFLYTIQPILDQFKRAKEKRQNAYDQLSVLFEEELVVFRKNLKSHFSQQDFKSSIALSSQTATLNIDKFLAADIQRSNKKLRQSEFSALNYYTRASTKTSPFAGFGPLQWLGVNRKAQQVFKLNQVLLIYWEEYVLAQEKFKAVVPFQLNPSIRKEKEALVFLVNNRNSEAIKRLPEQELLTYLLAENKTEHWPRKEWIKVIQGVVEAEEAVLSDFLEQLITEGVFLPVMPCAKEQEDWVDYWLEFLSALPSIDCRQEIAILEESKKLESTTLRSNQLKVQQVYSDWKKLLGENFNLRIERFIYRDDYKKGEELPEETWETAKNVIGKILPMLQTINFSSSKISVKKAFESLERDSIPLLEFYAFYHEGGGIDLKEETLAFKAKTKALRIKAKEVLGDCIANDLINISLEKCQEIFGASEAANHFWLGALMQIGEGLPFLRNSFPGHGKMMARFIREEKVSDEIIEIHKNQKETLFLDHGDNSAFNANLHPQLTPRSINPLYPTQEKQPPANLHLSALSIRKMEGDLVLWSEHDGRPLMPLNYGLEGLDRRSPLYQLIQSFGPQVPDIDLLVQLFRPLIQQVRAYGSYLPRLVLADAFVIQRKRWILNVVNLQEIIKSVGSNQPSGAKRDQHTHLFFAFNIFFKQHQIPTAGYFKLNKESSETVKLKKDFRKPQFLNIAEPTYFLRFLQLVQTKNEIILEEIYPIPPTTGSNAGYCQEWVLEWF